jgi:hypothetical protein
MPCSRLGASRECPAHDSLGQICSGLARNVWSLGENAVLMQWDIDALLTAGGEPRMPGP